MDEAEILKIVGGCVFTGGLGWWAHYVTTGAVMARKLVEDVEYLEKRADEHTQEVRAARQDIDLLRRDVADTRADIAGVAGNLQGLIEFIHNGKTGR